MDEQEITERRQAESLQRRAESDLAEAQRLAGIGSWSWDSRTGAVHWSEEMCRLLRFDPQQPIPKFEDMVRFYTPDSWVRLGTAVDNTFRRGTPSELDLEQIRTDGEHFWSSTRCAAVRDADGQVIGLRGTVADITARKQAAFALERSEERLNLALESARMGIWDLDLTTDTAIRNIVHDQIFGYASMQPAWGVTNFLAHVLPADREAAKKCIEEANVTDRLACECRIQWPDTSIHWIAVRGRAFRDDKGKAVRMLGTVVDITERKQAEADQRRIQASLSALIESTDDMVWSVDVECRLRTFNHALGQSLSLNHGTHVAVGMTPEELLPPAMASVWRGLYERALSSGPLRIEYQATYGPLFDLALNPIIEDGERTGVSVFAKDITERKRAVAALHESEAKFRALVDLVPQFIWTLMPDGMNVYFNQRWVEYTGMSLAESYGRGWYTPFHHDDAQAARNAWNHAVATGEPLRVEGRLRAADGSYRWFLIRGVPIRNAAGEVEKWFGSCTDVEDLKRVEQELREAQRELTLRQRIAEIFLTASDTEMYAELLEVILQTMDSKDGMFGYIAEDGALVTPSMTRVWGEGQIDGRTCRFPRETWTGIWGRSLIEKRALYSNRPGNLPEGRTPLHRALSVPILSTDELLGQFTVANRTTDYTEQDKARLERIAAYVAPVLRARLQRDRLEVARNLAQQRLSKLNEELEDRVRRRTAELEASNEQSKRSSETLERNERFLRTLIEHVGSGVALIDDTGKVSLVNARFREMFGLAPDTDILNIRDQDWGAWQVFAPDGRLLEVDEHPVRRAVLQRTAVSNQLVAMRFPSGRELRWLLISAAPVYAWDGAIESFVCTFHEVTDLRRAEESTRASERLLRDVIDGTPAMILLKDLEGRFLTVNKDLAARLGTTDERLRGKTDYDVFPKEVADGFRENDRRVAESGEASFVEEHVEFADGHRVFLASKFPLRDTAGRIYGVGTISHDITERKQIEEQNRLLNTDLEALVRERGAVIEELKASNKELESFSYSVSHDLRAPLRAIDSYARIVLDEYGAQLDDEAKKLLMVIRNSTARMAHLIDDLLAFSRLGRAELSRVVIDMSGLAKSAFLELTTPESRQRIDFQLGELPLAAGDPNLIKTVWMNLIGNALKFTATHERAVIRVTGEQAAAESLYAVNDDGVGFDMRYGDKLFGVFHRLHSVREFEGTGVGLAMVKRIIDRHGGRIWAEGEIEHGATFHFTLKRAG